MFRDFVRSETPSMMVQSVRRQSADNAASSIVHNAFEKKSSASWRSCWVLTCVAIITCVTIAAATSFGGLRRIPIVVQQEEVSLGQRLHQLLTFHWEHRTQVAQIDKGSPLVRWHIVDASDMVSSPQGHSSGSGVQQAQAGLQLDSKRAPPDMQLRGSVHSGSSVVQLLARTWLRCRNLCPDCDSRAHLSIAMRAVACISVLCWCLWVLAGCCRKASAIEALPPMQAAEFVKPGVASEWSFAGDPKDIVEAFFELDRNRYSRTTSGSWFGAESNVVEAVAAMVPNITDIYFPEFLLLAQKRGPLADVLSRRAAKKQNYYKRASSSPSRDLQTAAS